MLLNNFSPDDAVLIDAADGAIVTRRAIEGRATELARHGGGLAFLLADGTFDSAVRFHTLLASATPVALLDAAAPASQIEHLMRLYRPELIAAGDQWAPPPGYRPAGLHLWTRSDHDQTSTGPTHPDLAVLLTTSGSTGSPKFVRLSARNITANAEQIATSLALTPRDRGVSALPLHYSFGMSLLTSHAAAGSAVVVTPGSVIEPGFWQALSDHEVTLLPGVPQTYQMLTRLRFTDRFLPSVPQLRALMQAGGRLHREMISACAEAMTARGGEFFVMYGQTEASPRIACLPPARLAEKLGSVGVALTGGHVDVRDDSGAVLPPGQIGEIFYTGPNVMMGYAESREDLGLGDVHGDTLATGDIGYVDTEGFLFLTGRAKRIAKVAGLRVSLDEVEAMAGDMGLPDAVAVEAPDGVITLVLPHTLTADASAAVKQLRRSMRLPARSLRAEVIAEIPLLTSGKIDYTTLRRLLEHSAPEGGTGQPAPGPSGENQS